MRKLLTGGVTALTAAASIGLSAAPAVAQPHGWRGGHFHHDHRGWGWGVGAGFAGFALGATLANPNYYGPDYYYGPGYYDGYGGSCVETRRVWDPYYGGYVLRRFYYAC